MSNTPWNPLSSRRRGVVTRRNCYLICVCFYYGDITNNKHLPASLNRPASLCEWCLIRCLLFTLLTSTQSVRLYSGPFHVQKSYSLLHQLTYRSINNFFEPEVQTHRPYQSWDLASMSLLTTSLLRQWVGLEKSSHSVLCWASGLDQLLLHSSKRRCSFEMFLVRKSPRVICPILNSIAQALRYTAVLDRIPSPVLLAK